MRSKLIALSFASVLLITGVVEASESGDFKKNSGRRSASEQRERIRVASLQTNSGIQQAHSAAYSKAPFVNGHFVLGAYMKTNGYHSFEPVVIIVDKGSHLTHVLQQQNHEIVRILTVSNSIGSKHTPTPAGRYWVERKVLYPCWKPPKSIDPLQKPIQPYDKDPRNGLGVAKISLNKFDIVLHGTNSPNKIRKNVSHGCVRHSNRDIMKLFGVVRPGTVVYIVNRWRGKVLNQQDFKSNAKKG